MKGVILAAGFGVAAIAVAGVLAYQAWFAPEGSTHVDEAFPDLGAQANATPRPPLRAGSFVGADDFHFATGTVALHQAEDGTFVLRFEGYDAREGPDVYLYLTRNAGDRTTEAVEGQGLRLQVPGGEGDGRATLRGTFNLHLPAGTDALEYGGVAIWCDDFNTFFGHAALA